MKRVISACIALVLGAVCAATDDEYLLWMINSPDVVKDDVTMTFAEFSALESVNSARVAVSGGDLSGDTYLNIYALNGDNWIVSPSSFVEVDGDGYAGPIWSGLGDYAASTYSFTIELGHYDLTSDVWTLLARSESASYDKLYNDWSTASNVIDAYGAFEWTGGAYTAVPEPSGGMLFLLGGMILALRRRRSEIPSRVSRPLVALLALGLVFSADAETSTPITVTDAGFTISKSLMPDGTADLESALAATSWASWTNTFDWVAGYTAETAGDFDFDRSGGTNCGFPLGRYEQTGRALYKATGTLVVPEAGEWTICLGAQRDSDFNLTISGHDATFSMTEADFDQGGTARAVKTFNIPAAGEYSFAVDLFRVDNGAFMELSHAKGSVAVSAFSTETFKLIGKASAGDDEPSEDDPVEEDLFEYAASSWSESDFVRIEDNVFADLTPELVTKGDAGDFEVNIIGNEEHKIGSEASVDPALLTDGAVTGDDHSGRYAVRDGAQIVWTLAKPADISEFRFYASWKDNGRAGIAISSIDVKTEANANWTKIDGSTFRWCLNEADKNTITATPSDNTRRLVRFFGKDGRMLATDVVAVRISFGVQDNKWTGYVEIEAGGVPTGYMPVVATSTNTFGMATIYSTDTNTIIAVPWTWYSKREEDAGAIFAEKLVSPENLTPGDFLVLLTNAFGNATAKSAGYAAWTLDENLKWQPTATVACAPENGLAHTTILAGASNTVARGYGIWLLRQDPLDTDGAPKPFHVYGQFVSQGATVTVKGGGTRTAPVFTMLADPYLREVKVNEDIAWGSNPGAQDSLALVTDQTTFLYCKWDATKRKWWYPEVTYDEAKGQNVTTRITDIRVPAGAGFWYVRRKDGDFTVTWSDNK